MFPWTSREKVRYTALSSPERSWWHLVLPRSADSFTPIAGLLVLILVALSSFFAGRGSITSDSRLTIPLGTRSEVFRYSRMFGSAPSDDSDTAWASLFPEQGGYFKHPVIAPERSAFAVFHQLHCLVCQSWNVGYMFKRLTINGRTVSVRDTGRCTMQPLRDDV